MSLPRRLAILAALAAIVLVSSHVRAEAPAPGKQLPLAQQIARYAPTELTADVSKLSEPDRKALEKIVEAARLMDPLYLRQVWSGNVAMQTKLEADATPAGQERLHYFKINYGPWSRLDENRPFIEGAPRKPAGANYYPEDMSKEEFETWLKGLPESEKHKATGFFHLVRRGADRKLTCVPYSVEYKEFLEPAAKLLKEAAELTTNATLKKFLKTRAEAFGTDDYYESDVAWMELDAPIEPTIGPYETYEDELFGYKAAFEGYVTLRDDAESAKLAKFSSMLQELENNLPMDPKYRNPKIGAIAPIRVVGEVLSAGEGRRGVQAAAFNLPNDDKVTKEKGSKRVMLKNVQEAKFNRILVPISKIVLVPEQQGDVAFDAFFTHILMHELMHGIGPHEVTVDGKKIPMRKQLKDLYSAIEEAKADVTGLWALQVLIDKGAIDKAMEKTMYTTFLASMFRSMRFGINEAHGKGIAIQFNYFVDEGAIKIDEKGGTFSIDAAKIKDTVKKLTGEILTLEAEGAYDKCKALIERLAVARPPMKAALAKLEALPVDIEPQFPQAK